MSAILTTPTKPDLEGGRPHGHQSFHQLLTSIRGRIGTLNITVSILEKQATALTARLEGSDPNAKQAADELVKTQCKLSETRTAIEELKEFFLKVKKQWTKPKDRVIGHVVWAPPVSLRAGDLSLPA